VYHFSGVAKSSRYFRTFAVRLNSVDKLVSFALEPSQMFKHDHLPLKIALLKKFVQHYLKRVSASDVARYAVYLVFYPIGDDGVTSILASKKHDYSNPGKKLKIVKIFKGFAF
jgi:hypothetical protein